MAEKSCSFFVDLDSPSCEESISKESSLQENFQKFLNQKKIQALEDQQQHADGCTKRPRSEDELRQLRQKFLRLAFHYRNVPYKRKYWSKEDPEYHAPLFLDCCGLVRRICWDMRRELGFRLGPWNQAYMFDTLDERPLTEESMQPGDLVFISAVYQNAKARPQKHGMVHVEIWLGDGPKTIGARWQKGKVQVFDSYDFEATSYHSPVYHFRSIEPWLQGICQSRCPEHSWKRTKLGKSRHRERFSIFNFPAANSAEADTTATPTKNEDNADEYEEMCELQAGDTDDELVENEELEQEKMERLMAEFRQQQQEEENEDKAI